MDKLRYGVIGPRIDSGRVGMCRVVEFDGSRPTRRSANRYDRSEASTLADWLNDREAGYPSLEPFKGAKDVGFDYKDAGFYYA